MISLSLVLCLGINYKLNETKSLQAFWHDVKLVNCNFQSGQHFHHCDIAGATAAPQFWWYHLLTAFSMSTDWNWWWPGTDKFKHLNITLDSQTVNFCKSVEWLLPICSFRATRILCSRLELAVTFSKQTSRPLSGVRWWSKILGKISSQICDMPKIHC